MPQGTDAIVTGKPLTYTGGLYAAPAGTTVPLPGATAFEALDPAFIKAGYIGAGAKTVIASHATAKVSFTFTPDQTGRFVHTVSVPVFPDEAVAEKEELGDKRFRVEGAVVTGSVRESDGQVVGRLVDERLLTIPAAMRLHGRFGHAVDRACRHRDLVALTERSLRDRPSDPGASAGHDRPLAVQSSLNHHALPSPCAARVARACVVRRASSMLTVPINASRTPLQIASSTAA